MVGPASAVSAMGCPMLETPFARHLKEGVLDQGCELDSHIEGRYTILGVLSFEELATYLRDRNVNLHNVRPQ